MALVGTPSSSIDVQSRQAMPNAKCKKHGAQVSHSPHAEEEYKGKVGDLGGTVDTDGAADPDDRNCCDSGAVTCPLPSSSSGSGHNGTL